MPESHLRAADADRAAVATALGEHMSAGRLTLAEYDDRLARAYAAKTYGELAELTADLPSVRPTPGTQPARTHAAPPRAPATTGWGNAWAGGWGGGHDPHSWRSWLTTSLIVLTIWAATSLASWNLLYFWPVWVIGPWGAVLLAQTLGGRRDDDGPEGGGRQLER